MIVLDTNVVSETMRRSYDGILDAFFDRYASGDFALTTLTLFELRFGIEVMAKSAERKRLTILADAFSAGHLGPVLHLDVEGASRAAAFRASRQKSGRPVGVPDSLIAGIALRRGAALATRNVRDFQGAGLDLIDPWRDALR